mmetsp:Transcript_37335/g.92314  ORF Transcript_37335/g.92314 Transcript_37335/m.92314 type:complete len:227 (+) Transcript_37335:48-728(+)|eukprot:CAMPEP_0197614222 /NCGR_PEP_ID=MMETSP1326-20131121/59416_1 /TAXON_ID=1155430 /ORGANISM="Genus nov. species nov., Strain RCC2288" /LENGTH=226 /DNA_ID=CAMNT_0043183091 /DNA_START=36 /DNA_END=716 /DNA_ORIENTATION=-
MGCAASSDTKGANGVDRSPYPSISVDKEKMAAAVAPNLPPDAPETIKTVHSAIRWNKLGEVNEMVNCAALANLKDSGNGNTCLHIAAQNGHYDLVKLLVNKGATVNSQNKGGQTALHMAVSYDLDEVCEFLLSKGADDSVVNEDGFMAKFGLGGEKDVTSVAGMMEAFKAAATTEALLAALTNLVAKAPELDKATFASSGLRMKKDKKEVWSPAVQAMFVAVMQAM